MEKKENAARKGLRYLRERGVQEFASHAAEKVRDSRFDYQKWIRKQQISSVQAGYQKKLRLPVMPKVYVILTDPDPMGPEEERSARSRRTLRCIAESTYPLVYPAQALNSQILDEDYAVFVRAGDLLERSAVFEMVQAVSDGADAVYTDQDSVTERNGHLVYQDPLFKPDYNPDYLRSCNYIGTPFMVRAGLIRSVGREDPERRMQWSALSLADPAAYYEFVLRCSRAASEGNGIVHVPRVLCHVRVRSGSRNPAAAGKTRDKVPERQEEMRAVLEREIERGGLSGRAEDGPIPDTFHISWDLTENPLVSIVIPNKDNYSVLENCIWSIRNRSTYTNYEILVVENNSVEEKTFEYYEKLEEEGSARIVRYDHPFHFSRVVNKGVEQAAGEYVILMNNDVTVRTEDWIERLLVQCSRPGVGAAGPKLLYPDGRVQSAGIVVGLICMFAGLAAGKKNELK